MASTDAGLQSGVNSPTRAAIDEKTLREDNWWLAPLATFVVFVTFIIYSSWRAFSGADYYASPYLSPFYSPCLSDICTPGSSDFGTPFDWWRLSPALIILIFPLGFRFTCYYYRKAYYRAFWLSPPACAVAEPHKSYSGESKFPLLLQNIHRYFWYAAVVVACILTFDAVLAFRNADHEWGHMGLGTVLMWINVILIWIYTLSCHSCRNIVGGRLRHFSKHPVRYKMWTWVSKINPHHAKFAWYSLFSVALVDLYIYLLATGTITDLRFF